MSKNISNLNQDILDKPRVKLLDKLTPFLKGFVLGGGTALALQLNHRKSFDFDFFSSSEIPKNLLEKVSQKIAVSNISVDNADELTFFTDDKIKVTFLSYPFRHLFNLIILENGLRLFKVEDIAIQKAYTIGRRGEYRDYFDLYTILKKDSISLNKLIDSCKDVYKTIFSEKIFLEQLVYFNDLLNFDIIAASSTPFPSPDEVKRFFELLVKNHV